MAEMISNVSDLLVTAKAREVQRALLAEMQQDKQSARRHFLAAAHLEVVLAADYEQLGDIVAAVRSRISAASCLWRAGEQTQAESLLEKSASSYPDQSN